jgi:hypothetical protein
MIAVGGGGLVSDSEREGFKMNRRLLLSVALIAVLVCVWLALTRPVCQDGFAASLGPRWDWTCVAKGN